MDYNTVCRTLSRRLATVASERDPLVRVALDVAVRPWLEGIHTGAEGLRWGMFASTIQAVSANWWTGPAPLQAEFGTISPGPGLRDAVVELARTVASVISGAADTGGTLAWRHSASAAQILDAVEELDIGHSDRVP